MKYSIFLFFFLVNLSESLTRQEREQRRAQRRKNKKEKQDNKAASLGYNDSNELIHSNQAGQISPFLQYVYGIKSTTKKTTSTTTSTTTKEERTTEETTTAQTTTSAQTTTVPTTSSVADTTDLQTTAVETTVPLRDLSPAERKKRRKIQRKREREAKKPAYTSRPKTTKKQYNNLSDTLNEVQNIIFSAIWKNNNGGFVLPPMPEFPVTTEDPSVAARIIPRIQQDEFNVPNKETLDLIVNFEESNSNRFNRRREFETSALPKCNGEQLQLNLECEGCKLGFPKIDLCARFSREERIQEESEFKCKIDCGPGFKIAEGFNKVKCTKEKWKHMKKDVTEKTCVPIY